MKKKSLIIILGIAVVAISVAGFLVVKNFTTEAEPIADETSDENSLDQELKTEVPEESPIDPVEQALRQEKYFIEKRLTRYLAYQKLHPEYSANQIVKEINCDFDKTRYVDVTNADLSYGVLSLVSKYYYLDRYVPDDLVDMGSYGSGSSNKLAKPAADAFIAMADAAALDGITLRNVSGYRSFDVQNYLYNYYTKRDGSSASADTYSSRPGYSEHQTGLATDINQVNSDFEYTPAFKWLQAHAADYGFIMRYPKDLDLITGFMYEPWHYRYVGVEAARQIVAENLTYEEYYAFYVEK